MYVLDDLLNMLGDAAFSDALQGQPARVRQRVLHLLEGAVQERWRGDPVRALPRAFPLTFRVLADSSGRSVRFTAKVMAVASLPAFSGTYLPVHFDPRFVLTIELLEDVPAMGWETSQRRHLGIHSPSRLFVEESPEGGVFRFLLRRSDAEGVYSLESDVTIEPAP